MAVVIADSDGRADRRGATVISIGAAGTAPLRTTEHGGKRQEETFTDLVAAAAGIILGQRGRGAPVAVLRGIAYTRSDEGVAAMLHRTPAHERPSSGHRRQRNHRHPPGRRPGRPRHTSAAARPATTA